MNGMIQGFHVVNIQHLNEHAKDPTGIETVYEITTNAKHPKITER